MASEEHNELINTICTCLQEDGYKASYCSNISGGIINRAGLFQLDGEKVFVKYSQRQSAFGMFSSEHESLKLIHRTGAIRTPDPKRVMQIPGGGGLFLLEYLDDLRPVSTVWEDLGKQIARMHKHNIDLLKKSKLQESNIHYEHSDIAVKEFGFDLTIYVGPKHEIQPGWEMDWVTYYTRSTLQPLLEEIDKRTGDAQFREIWSQLQQHIDKPFRNIKVEPSLVHGDFCYINVGEWNKQPVLFDPGCSYRHNETDFVIPNMEKNFPSEFYQGYFSVLPKQEVDFEARKLLYLFGAYCLVFNVQNDEDMRTMALKTGNQLLDLICNK